MRQAQKEIDQSLDFLGVVHAPVCVLSTEGSSASGAFFPCFNTAAPCFSMEKMLPRHCSLRCFAHTQAHAVPTPKKSCDWSISFCACVIVFVSNARVNNVLFLFYTPPSYLFHHHFQEFQVCQSHHLSSGKFLPCFRSYSNSGK